MRRSSVRSWLRSDWRKKPRRRRKSSERDASKGKKKKKDDEDDESPQSPTAKEVAAWKDDSLHTKQFAWEQGILLQDLAACYNVQSEKDALFEHECRLQDRERYLKNVVEREI